MTATMSIIILFVTETKTSQVYYSLAVNSHLLIYKCVD